MVVERMTKERSHQLDAFLESTGLRVGVEITFKDKGLVRLGKVEGYVYSGDEVMGIKVEANQGSRKSSLMLLRSNFRMRQVKPIIQ